MEWVFFLGEPYNMCRWKREMKKEVSTLLILYKEHKLLFSLLINYICTDVDREQTYIKCTNCFNTNFQNTLHF